MLRAYVDTITKDSIIKGVETMEESFPMAPDANLDAAAVAIQEYRSVPNAHQLVSYPNHRKNVIQVIIPKAQAVNLPGFILGTVPRRVILGFVKNTAP